MTSEDSDPARLDRRELLFSLAGVIAALSPASLAQLHSVTRDPAGEYLFAPGLVYLNTAALGPTTRSVLERTLQAWNAILGRFERAMTAETRVVVVSHVVSGTGLRLPVQEIAGLARRRGIVSIVDGTQAAGAIDVDVRSLGCDAYIGTGHKWIMGPKGTGFAYINKDSADSIQPLE